MATSQHASNAAPIPDVVDWIVAAVIGIGGIALTAAGSIVLTVVDREAVASEVDDTEITVLTTERPLSDAEAATLVTDVTNWVGIGLVVTGLALAGFAVLYGITSYRARGREEGLTVRQHGRHAAVCGAVATAVVSFVPFAPVLGGGIAAYLDLPDAERSVRIGALAGVLAAVPVVVITAFTTVGLYTGLSVADANGARVLTVASMGLGVVLTLAVSAGLGGLGGYVTDEFIDDQRSSTQERPR